MVKNVLLADDVYERLKELKGNKSFSAFLRELIETTRVASRSEYIKEVINNSMKKLKVEVPELTEAIELCRILLLKQVDLKPRDRDRINSLLLGIIREEKG